MPYELTRYDSFAQAALQALIIANTSTVDGRPQVTAAPSEIQRLADRYARAMMAVRPSDEDVMSDQMTRGRAQLAASYQSQMDQKDAEHQAAMDAKESEMTAAVAQAKDDTRTLILTEISAAPLTGLTVTIGNSARSQIRGYVAAGPY